MKAELVNISGVNSDECEPQWRPFFGNNHSRIHNPHHYAKGGEIDLMSHIGHPLSGRLWVDLVYRLQVSRIRIYYPGEPMWLDGRLNGACTIHLDDEGSVERITFAPRQLPWPKKPHSWVDLLVALRAAMNDLDGMPPEDLRGGFLKAPEVPAVSVDEAREILEECWEWANIGVTIREEVGEAMLSDGPLAKLNIVGPEEREDG